MRSLVGDDFIEGIGDLARDADLLPGRRTEKSPDLTACSAGSNSASPPASV